MNKNAIIDSLAFLTALIVFPLQAYETRYVHVVIIDGARYSETFGDSTHQYIPRIWNRLRPLGTIGTRFYNDSMTLTSPAHASLSCGVWQNVPNDGSAFPRFPTIFEYTRKELRWPQYDNFVILGKDKLAAIAFSSHPEYGHAFGASVRYAVAPFDDTLTWRNIREVFQTHHPRISITNLAQVDVLGHTGIWEEYVRSIRLADSIVNEIWNLIQGDFVYRDKTTLIVTCDHGRHDTGDWSSHGCGCDGCRHLMFLMLGPDTRAGVVDTVRRTLIDIAPTIGEFLDFSTPYCEGVSIVPVRPPAIPVLLSPVDDARFQQIDLSLLWNQVPRTVHYHLQLSTTPSFDHLIIDDSLLGWNSKNVGPLDLNTTYYWRTRARNSGGSSAWSDTRRFTTVSTMPPVVLLTSPKNATTVSADSVELSWTTASPEAGCYYLEIALDSLMTRIFLADSAISGTAWMFRCTKNKTVFWWRVKARYFTGWAEWSQKGSFIVDIPVIFVPPERFSLDCDKSYKSGTPFVVRYNLPRASPVAIRLYSINGQLVKTLFKQVQQPEYHRLTLRSLPLSTGYYLLDFEAGEYKSTRRFYAY